MDTLAVRYLQRYTIVLIEEYRLEFEVPDDKTWLEFIIELLEIIELSFHQVHLVKMSGGGGGGGKIQGKIFQFNSNNTWRDKIVQAYNMQGST